MSEEPPNETSVDETDLSGWHDIAKRYEYDIHPALHPYIKSLLVAHGLLDKEQERTYSHLAPDVEHILSDIIAVSEDPLMRKALRAERRHESTPTLETVMDTIIGIKLLALEENDTDTLEHAERVLIDSYRGDEEATDKVRAAISRANSHRQALLEVRRQERRDLYSENGYVTDDRELFPGPEQLRYEHLSLVHATNYLPRLHESDGLRHISTTYDTTGLPRNTIHVALNHMVEPNSNSSDWSGKKFLIIAPMDEVVQRNGPPSALIAHDTWWEADPRGGIALPSETIIIRPGCSTAPVNIDAERREIRYKNHSIDKEDVESLLAIAGGYEVALLAKSLKVPIEPIYDKNLKLRDTSLAQYTTVVEESDRSKVAEALVAKLSDDRRMAEALFANTAKQHAVRKALELQGREVIEPLTVWSGDFMSEDVSRDIVRLRNQESIQGHHSLSVGHSIELRAMMVIERPEAVSEGERNALRQFIKENTKELSIKTLQMYYRMGLF